jgi:hypothetical protein
LNSSGGAIHVTTSSNSDPVTFDRSRLMKIRSAVARPSAFWPSTALIPPVVAAFGPSDQMTTMALDVRVVPAAQAVVVAPVAVLQTLSRVAPWMFPMPALRMPLVRVKGLVVPPTAV